MPSRIPEGRKFSFYTSDRPHTEAGPLHLKEVLLMPYPQPYLRQ